MTTKADTTAPTLAGASGRDYWRSLEDAASSSGDQSPEYLERLRREFPEAAAELEVPPVKRREFLGLLSASMALAGISLEGCIRKPQEHILPYNNRPEFLIPGKPRYFATAQQFGDQVFGLLVESQDGRPTKVEGNPQHPMNKGAANAWAQASVLGLYDPDRGQQPRIAGQPSDLATARALLGKLGSDARAKAGEGLAVLVQNSHSPTFRALLGQLRQKAPKAAVYLNDATFPANASAAAEMVGLPPVQALYELQQADVVLALDADFLGTEGDTVRNARLFNEKRRVRSKRDSINRLYAIEPTFSVTGAMADHRLQLPASRVGDFLADLLGQLLGSGVNAPDGAEALVAALKSNKRLPDDPLANRKPSLDTWVRAVAKDLLAHRRRSLVIVGERQPPEVHALALLLNAILDNLDRTMVLVEDADRPTTAPINALVDALQAGKVDTLLILGGNPVYDTPADLAFGQALTKAKQSIYLGEHDNETGKVVRTYLPRSHYLETWGDHRATDGTLAIQQPLIAPLHQSLCELELLALVLGLEQTSPYDVVRTHWRTTITPTKAADAIWRFSLHSGRMISGAKPLRVGHSRPAADGPALRWDKLGSAWARTARAAATWPSKSAIEVVFQLDWSVLDGRYAHNPWLQETPDPLTKLTWDNAALIGPRTSEELGVKTGDMITIKLAGRELPIAVFVTPGVAIGCVALSLGYGHGEGPRIARDVGFNGYRLQGSDRPAFAGGATVAKSRGNYALATTQDYGSLKPSLERYAAFPEHPLYPERPMAREATVAEYRKNPKFVEDGEVMEKSRLRSLWTPPNRRDGHQWGMTIDLNSCIGCNACMLACQAENNIPVVGKDRIANGREMHWLRIDRYYRGEPDRPEAVFQPVPCQQCENAPCEQVCPVAATSHSPDGLNDMAYNRCIGTRYCSNNCPYKVRRFNYFNFQQENHEHNPLLAMQRNPDVTVRFRGVMEKCTYCVQRVQQAKIEAKRMDVEKIPDGTITPACAQTCPTQAIVFGNVNDTDSQVSRLKRLDRNYAILAELNAHPRTTYLARLRNPNPDLA